MIIDRFSKYLNSVEYPKTKTSWNIAGIIKGQNSFYKFDVRDMFKLSDGALAQKCKKNTKADKIVLEFDDKWLVLDLKELRKYIKKNRVKTIYLEEMISKLEWTITLNK
jgi:hypothetical protein